MAGLHKLFPARFSDAGRRNSLLPYSSARSTNLEAAAGSRLRPECLVVQADSEMRIRQNLHSTLSRKFVSQVQEYQEMQQKYKNKYRDRVGRQLKVVKPDATQVRPSLVAFPTVQFA